MCYSRKGVGFILKFNGGLSEPHTSPYSLLWDIMSSICILNLTVLTLFPRGQTAPAYLKFSPSVVFLNIQQILKISTGLFNAVTEAADCVAENKSVI